METEISFAHILRQNDVIKTSGEGRLRGVGRGREGEGGREREDGVIGSSARVELTGANHIIESSQESTFGGWIGFHEKNL